GRYASVVKTLSGQKGNRDALRLMVEADLRLGNWKGMVGHLEGALKEVSAEQVLKDSGAQLDVFQLAYAYGQLRDGKGLRVLEERLGSGFAQLPELADGVNAVAAGTGIAGNSGAGTMAGLTNALADMNSLPARIVDMRGQVERRRQQREE